MLPLKQLKKYYIYLIEGALGNGKSLLACILAYLYRWEYKVKIASNMYFPFLDCTKIDSEDTLFSLKNTIIILDEFDILANYQNQQDSRVYYENLVKTLRKENNTLIIITQMCHLIPKKLRDMLETSGMICYPRIYNRFPEEIFITYEGKEYETDIAPNSYLSYQWFHYQDSFCRSRTNYNLLISYGKRYYYEDLWYWFKMYNTFEKPVEIELTTVRERKREKKRKED